MIKLPTLRSIVASTAIALMVALQAAPLALAKTASSAADNIDNLESDLKDFRTSSIYQTTSAFDTTSEINNYFDEINNSIDDVLSEIKAVTPPLNQADFDNVDDAYTSFKSEVKRAITVANTHSASSTYRSTYTSNKEDTDDNLDDLSDALDTLASKVTGATTGSTGNISSATVQNIIDNIDDATANVKDLNTEAAAVLGSTTRLDTFMDNLNSEGDDVLSQLKRITGSISANDLDDLDQATSDFKKEADKKIALAGSGSTTYGTTFDNAFKDARDSFRDDYKDKINTQIDRISGIALGVGVSNSALVNSAISFIEDSEDEANDLLTDESSVDTESELTNYMEDLISIVDDVESKLKRITGTVTQNDFDDLSDAVDSFEKEAKKVRDAVQSNSSATAYVNEYEDQNDDFKDALTDMNDALDNVEELIGTANTPGATNPNTTFFDVTSTSEFFTYITALAARNVVSGYADRSFHPKSNVTRAEFLKMALLARGRDITAYQNTASPFSDVASFHALRPYINYAVANNIITGQTLNGARYYYPERPITRAEATIILMRITGIAPGTATASRFMDVRDPEQIRYVEVAASQGVLNGYNATTFGPNDSLTREQAAKIVARINGIVR
jgi:hypothetical protein